MEPSEPTLSRESLLEHAAWIRRLAHELVRDPGTAEDLAQDTWLAFLRNKPAANRPLRPWLATVLRNAAATRVRRLANRTRREQERATQEGLPSSEQLVVRAEEQRLVADAVLALEDPYRSVLLLRYYEGLSPSQIASARRCPAATVRTHLHRGLALLRERLDREHGGQRQAWILMLKPLLPRTELTLGSSLPAWAGAMAVALLLGAVGYGLQASDSEPAALEFAAEPAQVLAPSTRAVAAPDRTPVRRAMDGLAQAQRRIQLLDPGGTPLAHYELQTAGEEHRSDGLGWLLLPVEVRAFQGIDISGLAVDVQTTHLRWERRSLTPIDVTLPSPSESPQLTLAAGPTYSLRLNPLPPGAVPLEARLLPPATAGARLPIQVAPVRFSSKGQAWVRFAAIPEGAQPNPSGWMLELRDRQGLWHAISAVDQVERMNTAAISLRMENTASIEVSAYLVPSQSGSALLAGLLPVGSTGQFAYSAMGDPKGTLTLRWVYSGEYELEVQHPAYAPWSETVSLAPNQRSFYAPNLAEGGSTLTARGSIKSTSGRYAGQLLVFLLDDHGRTLDIYPTSWKANPEGELEAEFHFGVQTPGQLHLDVVSLQDSVSYWVNPAAFQAPTTNIAITLLDQLPASDWNFDVSDSAGGTALHEFDLVLRLANGSERTFRRRPAEQGQGSWTLVAGSLRWNTVTGPARLRGLPDNAQFKWTLSAPGYEPAHGTQADFNQEAAGLRSCSVQLHAR